MDGMRGDQKPRERSQLSEKAKAGGCVNLREQVHQMWPTPRVSDTEGGVVKNVALLLELRSKIRTIEVLGIKGVTSQKPPRA